MSSSSTSSNKKGRMFRGAVWMATSRVFIRFLGLVSTVVLARFLSPEDFGLVAIAMSIVGVLRGFTELGFNQALIHYQDASDHDYGTAWTLNGIRGLILAIILLTLSYPLSISFDDSRLLWIFIALAFVPLLDGFENPRIIEFEKQLRFDVLFRLTVLTKIAGVTTAISVALALESYWALIAGMIVTATARLIGSFILARARVKVTLKSFGKLIRFSGWLSGAEIMATLGAKLNPALLAVFAPPQIVGIFHMARELTWTTFNEVASPLRRVLFPALSRHETGSSAFVSAYSQAVAGLFMILAPISLGLSLTADDLVPLVLGDQWLPAIEPIRWIALALVVSVVGRVAQSAVMAAGRTRMLFYRNLVVMPIRLLLFGLGAATAGLPGAVAGMIGGILVDTLVTTRMGSIVTGITGVQHFLLPARSWVALAVMVPMVSGIDYIPILWGGEVSSSVAVIAKVMVGAVSYGVVQIILWHRAGRPHSPERIVIDATSWAFPGPVRRYLAAD